MIASPCPARKAGFAAAAALLDGETLRGADAYGKHLFLDFGNNRWMHVHLGIYGRLSVAALPALPPVGQVRMRLVGSRVWADLRGAAVCELIGDEERAAALARLGPDPLRADADDAQTPSRLLRRSRPGFPSCRTTATRCTGVVLLPR